MHRLGFPLTWLALANLNVKAKDDWEFPIFDEVDPEWDFEDGYGQKNGK